MNVINDTIEDVINVPIDMEGEQLVVRPGVNINWQQSKSSGQQNGSIIKEL